MKVLRSISLHTGKDMCRVIFKHLHIPNIALFTHKNTPQDKSKNDGSRGPPIPPRRREDVNFVLQLQSYTDILSTTMCNKLHTNGFISQDDFMAIPGFTFMLIEQAENLSTLWDMFFPGMRCLPISEIDEESVKAFASHAASILSGRKIPRTLPLGMLAHSKVERLCRISIENIWESDPVEFKNRILAWYPWNASLFGTLLETWIDKASGGDIGAISEAISSLMNQYGSIKSLEFMDATRLGNLIAILIQKCDSLQNIEDARAFINSIFSLVGPHRMIPIFNALVCRLDQDGIILSFYLFYRKFEEKVFDLLSAVDRELQKIDSADLVLDHENIRFLRSYYHIAEYLGSHEDYWNHDIFFHLTTIAERRIGYKNRLIWYSIGKEEVYNWATSNMPLFFRGFLAYPEDTDDVVHSQEALDSIISTLMEQHTPSNAPGPADREAIASLPKKNLDEEMLGREGKAECSICMDNVLVGNEVVVLPCSHWYHVDCNTIWLSKHNTCPICRKGIPEIPLVPKIELPVEDGNWVVEDLSMFALAGRD